MSAGKGDTPRPTNMRRYGENYDAIDWSGSKTQIKICESMKEYIVQERLKGAATWYDHPNVNTFGGSSEAKLFAKGESESNSVYEYRVIERIERVVWPVVGDC